MTTGASIARTPNRLNLMNEDIRTREIYLSIVDVIAGDGDIEGDEAGDDGTRSMSMSGGGRARPFAGAHRRSNWICYGGSTATRTGKNPRSIR